MSSLLISLMLSLLVPSVVAAGFCENSNIKTIHRPVNPDVPGGKSFEYRYSVSEGREARLPVVIFIPGGPGQTSIDMPSSLPSEFTLIRTDPRGVGCNQGQHPLPLTSLKTEFVVKDILALIADIQPRSYVLHGISYGSIVATQVAALAVSAGVPKPTAVVLEGVIGRAYKPEEVLDGFRQQWQRLKTNLPAEVVEVLSREPLPFGYGPDQWGSWIQHLLFYGKTFSGEHAVGELSLLAEATEPLRQQAFRKRMARYLNPSSVTPERLRVYRENTCREITDDIPDLKYDLLLIDGDLVRNSVDICKGLELDRPFDARRFPVMAPLFSFVGTYDPATGVEQAQYHLNSQTGSERVLVTVNGGGHHAMSLNLSDCSGELWKSIATSNFSEFVKDLGTCELGSSYQYLPESQ